MDFFGAMEKRGYKIAFTEKETKDHKVVFDKFGNPVFEPDIDVRVGENACFSGYEDVQARVIDKKGKSCRSYYSAWSKLFEYEKL